MGHWLYKQWHWHLSYSQYPWHWSPLIQPILSAAYGIQFSLYILRFITTAKNNVLSRAAELTKAVLLNVEMCSIGWVHICVCAVCVLCFIIVSNLEPFLNNTHFVVQFCLGKIEPTCHFYACTASHPL